MKIHKEKIGNKYGEKVSYFMKKIVFLIFTLLSVSVVYAQTTDNQYDKKPQTSPIGLYFEAIIPPFINDIAYYNGGDTWGFPFGGGITYTDFGLGVTFFHDILKAQINYGFIKLYGDYDDEYRLPLYNGNVFSLKLLACPEINFGKLFGSSWNHISASFGLGLNFSLFEYYYVNDGPTWINSWNLQFEFPKFTFPDRNFLRSFSFFIECEIWELPIDDVSFISNHKNIFFGYYEFIMPRLVLGIRLYIF